MTIRGLHGEIKPRQRMMAEIVASDGRLKRIPLLCRIDTLDELDYFKHGGIRSTCCASWWRPNPAIPPHPSRHSGSPRIEWRVIAWLTINNGGGSTKRPRSI